MEKVKKYGKIALVWTAFLIFYIIILVFLNYFGILKYNTIVKINFVVVAIVTFILGIINGKTAQKKGYIEGLKLGSIISFMLFILNLIFYRVFNLNIFIYYLIIIVSSIFGSMLGINLKKN